MTVPSLEELDSFKYSDLQNLAKSLGLRANLRADKLLRALKAHLKNEARKENENQDEIPLSASSCDKTEIQIGSQEQAEREVTGHVTKMRRRRRTALRNPGSQDHSEMKICDPTEFQNQEKQENQALSTAVEVPSPTDESQRDENAVSSGKSEINGHEDSKVPSERKKSLYTDGFSKSGKNKRTTSTTPNFRKLHEARFKEMESIDQYIERKKKHFEEHNSFNELKKQPVTKEVVATPLPLPGKPSVACTPASQRPSQGRPHAGRSTLCGKGSAKRSALSATKMNVRFSAATKDNEHKRSLTKTPARKSPHGITSGSTPKGQTGLGTHKLKTTRGDSAAVITPFKLTAEAAQTPISHRKPVFDLKASLSRPLNYEPHKGKLKPWGQSKENSCLNERVNRVSFHKKTYKQPPRLQIREEQRKKHEQERKEKKAKVLGVRRGLIMAEHS
ncbi:nucleolar and spindle-associated protein 1 isoform X1 [Camelus ferus]|uniref:Nucleolar and spindle-associated protein 1 isoform X1 n=2 Tax=Camelus TaxID=9836 RepID=A0A8B7K4S7_CAMFR|nr:nucleolar and spindle-associated protein 1 isoform X1 [Camelus bactrianus]XP_014407770.1 nucleolar and spindle-associated protein 1 isoform X1 [Camelus ferus]